jgi:hypothetical protein
VAEQLPLRYDGVTTAGAWWRHLLGEMERVVSFVTLKQAAFDLDLKPSALAHSLAERDNRHPRAEWIPYLVHRAPDLELARALVAPAGLVVDRAPEMTPAEELASLHQVLAEQLGPDIRAALVARARRR